jgi:hypothetical protein
MVVEEEHRFRADPVEVVNAPIMAEPVLMPPTLYMATPSVDEVHIIAPLAAAMLVVKLIVTWFEPHDTDETLNPSNTDTLPEVSVMDTHIFGVFLPVS